MSEASGNRYEPILNHESSEFKKLVEREAKFLAFEGHLSELGRHKEREPRLQKGDTTISIPAFFRLPEYSDNQLNAAALELLPTFSYSPGYGDTTSTSVDDRGLMNLLFRTDEYNEASAAREGRLLQVYMREQLGLGAEAITCFRSMRHDSALTTDHRYHKTSSLVRGITEDIDGKIVGSIEEIAELVEAGDYQDFFDYLLDVKQVTDNRIETIFSHPANGTAEELSIF